MISRKDIEWMNWFIDATEGVAMRNSGQLPGTTIHHSEFEQVRRILRDMLPLIADQEAKERSVADGNDVMLPDLIKEGIHNHITKLMDVFSNGGYIVKGFRIVPLIEKND